MKRFAIFILSLCLILGLTVLPVLATETEEPVTSGSCGKNITWEFDPNGDCLRAHFVTFLHRLEYQVP